MPGEAVNFVARQVQMPAGELDAYEWSGRTVEYHRAQIRGHLGFASAVSRMRTSWPAGSPSTSRARSGGRSRYG
ncbi:hypothetical protein ITI46_27515 [Streptomyces oryzae]|uniref:DUF4158 domain-containing protein n=1 Tax=Streptomyces oryzae TaxID=1434886 RepID=A0ABS3XJ74_9ACTN|nr:hypothetical protein [Streptomyces oryzae]